MICQRDDFRVLHALIFFETLLLNLPAVMCVTTLLISVASERLEVVLPGSPYFSSLEHTAITFGIISLGAALAFMMVGSPTYSLCFASDTSFKCNHMGVFPLFVVSQAG